MTDAPTITANEDGIVPTVVIPAVQLPVIPNPDDTLDSTPVVTHEDLPEVLFPAFIRLDSETLADFTGALGSAIFENGVSTQPHSLRTVYALAGGGGWPVVDVATGIRLSPLSENQSYRVSWASRAWCEGAPYPDHVVFPASAPGTAAPAAPEAGASIEAAPAEAPAETVRSALDAVRDAKGARFLRQLCEQRGLPTARSGDDMIETLALTLTLDEAKALLA